MFGRRYNNRFYLILMLFGTLFVTSCFSANEETVKTMTSIKLCRLLTPKYITLRSENVAIRAELLKRGVRCGDDHITKPIGPERRRDAKGGAKGPSSGSGFAINSSGDIITNDHVVRGCKKLFVVTGGNKYPAVTRYQDKGNDLAIIRSSSHPFKAAARFRSSQLKLGEKVIALGYPLGKLLGQGLKATIGNVSGLTGLGGTSTVFQFTAPIQPGNSGGPVLDMQGAIAGVTFAKLDEIKLAKATGSMAQLVNLGIKSPIVLEFLRINSVAFSVSRSKKANTAVNIIAEAGRYTVQVLCN